MIINNKNKIKKMIRYNNYGEKDDYKKIIRKISDDINE
jgi:hypothetical protein